MYESPIQLYMTDIQTQLIKQQEEQILKAVQRVAVGVGHDELHRALKYDREQYKKGYQDAINDKDLVEVVRCKDCIHWKKGDAKGGNSIEDLQWLGGCKWAKCCRREMDFCSMGERKTDV